MSKVELKVDWATHEAAKYACLNWHYSKSFPAGKTTKIGVWESEVFIGAIIFSRGSNKHIGNPFGLKIDEVAELARVALKRHEAPVSKMLSLGLKMLKNHSQNLRLVVSFADTGQSHHGGIYQATNWIYTGFGTQDKRSRPYRRGKVVAHWRTVAGELSQNGMPSTVEAAISRGWTPLPQNIKHRYLMPLDKKMRKQILPLSQPYPKRSKQAMDATSVTAMGQHQSDRSTEASHA